MTGAPPAPGWPERLTARLMKPLEALSALLLCVIVVLLLGGVVARYVFALPVVWIDEIVSLSFLWLAMLGSVIAMRRNEHLRLTLVVDGVALDWQSGWRSAFGTAITQGLPVSVRWNDFVEDAVF